MAKRRATKPFDEFPAVLQETATSPRRRRGRPKGSLNKFTVEKEKVRDMLDSGKLGSKKRTEPLKEPREILIEAANFWWDRAAWLSAHARKLAELEADQIQIDAIMAEAQHQLTLSCKAAEQAAPYYHARLPCSPLSHH